MKLVIVCGLAVLFFLLLMLSLSFRPRFMVRLSGAILLFTGVSGVFLYGCAYAFLYENIGQAVARTLFSVFCMFLGRNEISAISAVPFLSGPGMQIYIYAVHLLALYFTASAVVAALGTRLVRTVRLWLLRWKKLELIYGVNADALAFAKQRLAEKNRMIVFVDNGKGAGLDAQILQMGSLMLSAEDAATPTTAFLKKIGMKPGSRQLTVYCLDEDISANLRYAKALRDVLEQAGILPEQTSLTALLEDEAIGAALQNTPEAYGYGTVLALPRADLVARLMTHVCPPWETMGFDDTGRATEDFEALILGFGQIAQSVLRSLIMNGQFEGSKFHATVISTRYSQKAGSFLYRYPALKKEYDLEFLESGALSIDTFRHLEQRFKHLNYVAICMDTERENEEIAAELARFLRRKGMQAPILLCSERGVSRFETYGSGTLVSLYSPDVLCSQRLDEMAMAINHRYHLAEGRTPAEDWRDCDYFSRMSCRASADYAGAFLAAAGRTAQDVKESGWRPEGALLENLSRAEHLRWCAFHFASGYQTMSDEVFEKRAEEYRKTNGAVRIGKDAVHRRHACLIPWEDLDALGEKEAKVTGKAVDYKEMDRENVRELFELIQKG